MRVDALLLPVALVLATCNDGVAVAHAPSSHCLQELHLLAPDRIRIPCDGRSHPDEGQDLQQVVLGDVAKRAGLLVELPMRPDSFVLRNCYLHVVYVAAIPDRFEDRVGETENKQILNRLLAQVMIDAEDLILRKPLRQERVQIAGRVEIVAKRFLDYHPLPSPGVDQAVLRDLLGDGAEEAGE